MTDPINNSEDILKKPGRRNWLRNAAMAATGALVLLLVLTGCTKEQFPLPGGGHGGGVGGSPDVWYNLKATYKDRDGDPATGYLTLEQSSNVDPQWFYMVMRGSQEGAAKFRFHASDSGDGWQFWQMSDGSWLSILSTGTAYSSGYGNVAWKIINGKLYTNYYKSWTDQALGAQWYHVAQSQGYYTSVNYGSEFEMTNCELVPAQ